MSLSTRKHGNGGGVEESKEDEPMSPMSPQARLSFHSAEEQPPEVATAILPPETNSDPGLGNWLENLFSGILGSCGNALLVMQESCGICHEQKPVPGPTKPPLSITDELRRLAAKEGRVFGGGMRRADIPRLLGEEAVYSFEDDNISAISQNTLEELTKHGIAFRKQHSHDSDHSPVPDPVPTHSHSTSDNSDAKQADSLLESLAELDNHPQ